MAGHSAPLRHLQATFASGELSPSLYSRVDLQRYASGLKTCRNFNVLPQGGIRNRPGTKYVATAKTSSKPVRIIPFVISTDTAYVIELGDLYARFYTNGGQVLSGGLPYEIATPWAAEDLALLKFTQSADILFLAHPNYAPRTITFNGPTSWVLDFFLNVEGPFMVQNTDITKTITPSALTGNISLTASAATFVSGQVGALFEIVYSIFAQSISEQFTSFGTDGTAIRTGRSWRVTTTGTWTGILIVQVSTDKTTWFPLSVLRSTDDANYELTGDTGFSQCWIRVISEHGIHIDPFSGQANTTLQGNSFDWKGVVKITAVTDSTHAAATVINISGTGDGLGGTSAQYQWSEGSWSEYRGFPACCAFYQDRLAFASTKDEPTTVWLTKTGNYYNFGTSFPLLDTDSISIPLPSRQINVVRNLVVLNSLIALTSDMEWSIGPASGAGSLTPTSVDVKGQGHRGSAPADPVLVGNEVLMLQQLGTIVRNLIFQLAVDGYMGDNISIFSQHLFTGYQIIEMAYAAEPDSIVWAVRSDGTLLSLTYLREQEVIAWSPHDTGNGDLFKSVTCVPNYSEGFSETWVVVKRGSSQFIERFASRDQGTDPKDCYFVDSGLSYDGSPATEFSGLGHLEGKTVAVLADGNVVNNKVVTAGKVTLDAAASKVHIGLPYTSQIETLDIELSLYDGTAIGRRARIARLTAWVWNSRGGQFSAGQDYEDIFQRTDELPYDTPVPLQTQQFQITPAGDSDYGARVRVRQADPLPLTLLSIVPQITVGGS